MKTLLIVCSTTDGHTPLICERLAAQLRSQGQAVNVLPLAQCSAEQLAACGAVVIGASVRYGKHKPEVAEFIRRYQALLELRPNALFSVNVVARKPGKDVPEGNPYLQKLLRSITWRPQRLEVFAGRLDYPSMKRLDRLMIRLIMWMGKGPTDPRGVYEFTNWQRVDAFALELGRMLSAPGVGAAAAEGELAAA